MIVKFEEYLDIFIRKLELSINLQVDFWSELLNEAPDIAKL